MALTLLLLTATFTKQPPYFSECVEHLSHRGVSALLFPSVIIIYHTPKEIASTFFNFFVVILHKIRDQNLCNLLIIFHLTKSVAVWYNGFAARTTKSSRARGAGALGQKNRAPVRALTFFDFVVLKRSILIEPKVCFVGVVLSLDRDAVKGFDVVEYCFVSLKGDD